MSRNWITYGQGDLSVGEHAGTFRSFLTPAPKPKMSISRLLGTALSLTFALLICFMSLFYIPAFVNKGKVLGAATQHGKMPEFATPKTGIQNYLSLFTLRRGYFKADQKILIEYQIPPGATLIAKVKTCNGIKFIEVFKCGNMVEQHLEITGQTRGTYMIGIPKTGFYYFDEEMVFANPEQTEYQIFWSRLAK